MIVAEAGSTDGAGHSWRMPERWFIPSCYSLCTVGTTPIRADTEHRDADSDGVRVRLVPADCVRRLALTFGTLLSSQGADAHPGGPLGRSRGNPGNATRCGSQCQPLVPDPLWSLSDNRCRRSDLKHPPRRWPDPLGMHLDSGAAGMPWWVVPRRHPDAWAKLRGDG